ncbi:MAG: hypothetical protein RLZZ262_175 [Bacteroidota bacterium]|jgi:hypothetical protein
MAAPYILRYIAEGEHQTQDFKMRIDDSKKIARTVAAFANTDGGRLLIGVKDNGQIAGVRYDEEIHMLEAAAKMYCKPPVDYTVQAWKIENRTVLEINIEPSRIKPHVAINEENEWKIYIRHDDRILPAPSVLREYWKGTELDRPQRYFHTEKEKRIFEALTTHGALTFSQLTRHCNIRKDVLTKLLAGFMRWELIDMTFDHDLAKYHLR